MVSLLNNYLVTVIAIVGLIVLTAMNKVSASVAIPLIVTLTGVHVGSNLASNVPTTGGTGK